MELASAAGQADYERRPREFANCYSAVSVTRVRRLPDQGQHSTRRASASTICRAAGGTTRPRLMRARGEHWFCTESEAKAAGWRPSKQWGNNLPAADGRRRTQSLSAYADLPSRPHGELARLRWRACARRSSHSATMSEPAPTTASRTTRATLTNAMHAIPRTKNLLII